MRDSCGEINTTSIVVRQFVKANHRSFSNIHSYQQLIYFLLPLTLPPLYYTVRLSTIVYHKTASISTLLLALDLPFTLSIGLIFSLGLLFTLEFIIIIFALHITLGFPFSLGILLVPRGIQF